LGVRRVHWGGYHDTLLPSVRHLIDCFERVLGLVRPDFIFVNNPDDTHQDHRQVARAAVSATRYARNVLFYEGPTTVNFTPTVFIDIADEIERKLQALQRHRSQVQALQRHRSQVFKTRIEGTAIGEMARAEERTAGTQA